MSISIDPVNLVPVPPLRDSYVFHSPLPVAEQNLEEGWIMGIDEAGRGRESNTCPKYGCMKLIKILLAVLGRTIGYIICHRSLIRFRTNGLCRSLLSFVI